LLWGASPPNPSNYGVSPQTLIGGVAPQTPKHYGGKPPSPQLRGYTSLMQKFQGVSTFAKTVCNKQHNNPNNPNNNIIIKKI